jgi:hypothetical protein
MFPRGSIRLKRDKQDYYVCQALWQGHSRQQRVEEVVVQESLLESYLATHFHCDHETAQQAHQRHQNLEDFEVKSNLGMKLGVIRSKFEEVRL